MTKENIKTIMAAVSSANDIIRLNADKCVHSIVVDAHERKIEFIEDDKIHDTSVMLTSLWLYLHDKLDKLEFEEAEDDA